MPPARTPLRCGRSRRSRARRAATVSRAVIANASTTITSTVTASRRCAQTTAADLIVRVPATAGWAAAGRWSTRAAARRRLVRLGNRAFAVAQRLVAILGHAIELLAHVVALAQRLVACSHGLLIGLRGLVARGDRLRQPIDGGVSAVSAEAASTLTPSWRASSAAAARSPVGPGTAARQARRASPRREAVAGASGTRGASRCASRPSSHPVAERPSRLGSRPLPDPVAGRPSRRAPRKLSRRSSRLGRALIRCSLAAAPGSGSATVMSGATVSSILPSPRRRARSRRPPPTARRRRRPTACARARRARAWRPSPYRA